MELTVYNPQKGRHETVEVEFTQANTTWFDNCVNTHDIYMITDFKGGIIISGFGNSYPAWIYNSSRDQIGNNQKRALEMIKTVNY